jgi:hypothetical protein
MTAIHFKRKWTLLLCSAPLLICLLPLGCMEGYVWRADLAVRPVVRAVEAFKNQTGKLPANLSELPEQKRGNRGLKLEGSSNVGLIWSINYENRSNDVYYENGKRRDVGFNLFR